MLLPFFALCDASSPSFFRPFPAPGSPPPRRHFVSSVRPRPPPPPCVNSQGRKQRNPPTQKEKRPREEKEEEKWVWAKAEEPVQNAFHLTHPGSNAPRLLRHASQDTPGSRADPHGRRPPAESPGRARRRAPSVRPRRGEPPPT